MSRETNEERERDGAAAGVILLVDDEEDIVLYLQTALEDGGYRALAASSALEGLRILGKETVDLVCVDVLMPEESGLSFYRKLKASPDLAGIPVILMSGLAMSGELGRSDYLTLPDGSVLSEPEGFIDKPVDVALFMSLVAKTLRGAS